MPRDRSKKGNPSAGDITDSISLKVEVEADRRQRKRSTSTKEDHEKHHKHSSKIFPSSFDSIPESQTATVSQRPNKRRKENNLSCEIDVVQSSKLSNSTSKSRTRKPATSHEDEIESRKNIKKELDELVNEKDSPKSSKKKTVSSSAIPSSQTKKVLTSDRQSVLTLSTGAPAVSSKSARSTGRISFGGWKRSFPFLEIDYNFSS